MKIYFCEFIMWQRVAFAMTVVPLAIGGGVLAPFVCGMHAEQGATVGFCLASWQSCRLSWLPPGSPKPANFTATFENACFRGTQAKFRDVFVVGLCAFVIVLPTALIGASSGAPARFATVMLGGMVLSTAAALTLLPVLIPRIKE
jgi:Cu/Ag efflux pump CusA